MLDWLGSYGGCATRDPIPNSTVKPPCADDTSAQAGGKVGRCQAYLAYYCITDKFLIHAIPSRTRRVETNPAPMILQLKWDVKVVCSQACLASNIHGINS